MSVNCYEYSQILSSLCNISKTLHFVVYDKKTDEVLGAFKTYWFAIDYVEYLSTLSSDAEYVVVDINRFL